MTAARAEGTPAPSAWTAEIFDRALDGVAITRQSDGAILYANAALRGLLGDTLAAEPVAALAKEGRIDAVELAHPDEGGLRLIVAPRERRRAAERPWRRDLRREMARARRRKWPLSVGALALDAAGSPHLAAAAWSAVLREEDSLSPHEGGTYILVLPDCSIQAAEGVGARLRQVSPPPATVSIGLAVWAEDEPLESLIARALGALMQARGAGGDRSVADREAA